MSELNFMAIHATDVETFYSTPHARRKLKGSPESIGLIVWEQQMSLQNFMAIYSAVEII